MDGAAAVKCAALATTAPGGAHSVTDCAADVVAAVKTSALAIVPERAVWPVIQALRIAHDRHVRIWPPHINILYPFVPERDFDDAARRLADSLAGLRSLKIKLNRMGRLGNCAVLLPECEEDPGLVSLRAACSGTCPDLPPPEHAFTPHLTVGQFGIGEACAAFVASCPPIELELRVDSLALLARDTMVAPFRTVALVRLGKRADAGGVCPGEGRPYAWRTSDCVSAASAEFARQAAATNYWQADKGFARFVFRMEAAELRSGDAAAVVSDIRRTLFVVDRSGSMGNAYAQVKDAVRYMQNEARGSHHELAFVLYDTTAQRATAEEVLGSGVTGMTSFEDAFRETTAYLSEQPPCSAVTVVFMTDGQDTRSRDLPGAKATFREFLQDCNRQVMIHSIGFTHGHNRELLEEICAMGSSPGLYRYAETGEGILEARLSEMFDFIDVHVKSEIRIAGETIPCSGEDAGDGYIKFDVMLRREQLPAAAFASGEKVSVEVPGMEWPILLDPLPTDPMFSVRCVDEKEIATQADLDEAQAILSAIQVHKAPKFQRQDVMDAKQDAQNRLDKYHQLFARGVRSSLSAKGGNLAAELSSLRHEATFSKARRARAMAQRATANAAAVPVMEKLLHALPEPTEEDVAAIDRQRLCCVLSGDGAVDIMRGSTRDFFVFSLRVRRPEDVIDAPTVLEVAQVFSGAYSNEAFRNAAEYAVRTFGPEQAHGGFAGTCRNAIALGPEVGLFRGADGQMMNACLPLYLNEAHFARVRIQIKPILGYFFTLDPLGYKGDQLIAFFGILGRMLCLRAEGALVGEWADWLISDFTMLCNGIRPLAMDYLASGGYGGAPRGDLLEEFLASPAGRSKEQLPSLGVLMGWAACVRAEPTPHFHAAFAEELWRRGFGAKYKGQPREPILETLEQLLYGDGGVAAGDAGSDGAATAGAGAARNGAAKDRDFALWGRFLRKDLSKKQAEEVKRRFGTTGPEVEGLLSPDEEFKPRDMMGYEDAPAYLDALVDAELAKIHCFTASAAALYGGPPLGEGLDPKLRRLMLIQALHYVGNDTMTHAVERGAYLDTFPCFTEDATSAEQRICAPIHERFEQQRRERSAAVVRNRNALLTARQIAAASDMDAFVGRCAVSCPTRGGDVFDCLVAVLAAGNAGTPLHAEKVEALLTGKVGDDEVIAKGTSWVHCPLETARQLSSAVGEELFMGIELKMRGTWGHIYRASDIPNRHGHCNSNPNTSLVVSFSGFRLAAAGGG